MDALLTTVALLGGLTAGNPTPACSAASAGGEKDIVATALAAGDFGTLATALERAGLVDTLRGKGPFTVFAPTDAAFAKLPRGTLASLLEPESADLLTSILTYHVVSGAVPAAEVAKLAGATAVNGSAALALAADEDGVRVAGARVVKTDIRCSNGIIHVVDAVLMPATQDIVETAVAAEGFDTLAAALRAAGLVDALKGKGPFTVFAPTDEAFAALPDGTLETLLRPENRAQLVSILKLHVVPGRVFSDQLVNGDVRALEGRVTVRIDDDGVEVSGASVVRADLQATNGVIHVIDGVILPE